MFSFSQFTKNGKIITQSFSLGKKTTPDKNSTSIRVLEKSLVGVTRNLNESLSFPLLTIQYLNQ